MQPQEAKHFDGLTGIIRWVMKKGDLHKASNAHNFPSDRMLGRPGIVFQRMRNLNSAFFLGDIFTDHAAPIVPKDARYLPAITAYCFSNQYKDEVRKIDSTLKASVGSFIKVPFSLDHWTKIAEEKYPNGLPKPYSDDPTQWIFHGHPAQNDEPLQVAVARLLGYRWPAETDDSPQSAQREETENSSSYDGGSHRAITPKEKTSVPSVSSVSSVVKSSPIELSEEAYTWIARCKDLDTHTDDDGIVCIPTIRDEKPAAERLLSLLQTAYDDDWSAHKLNQLLANAGAQGKGLDWWLREKFFEQHCKLFQHRPFIWHIWDGLTDGFAALVNYHKLDHKTLETLIYTYLGDWIGLQERAVSDGVDGADLRLTAAQDLKKRLELILEGDAPYDIFVRWKPLEQQSIAWNPDLNDGVRLNIRPFMTASVLRHNKKPKLNIHWNKDRGKDVESAPWYSLGLEYGGKGGDRINAHHLSLAAKRAAGNSTGG